MRVSEAGSGILIGLGLAVLAWACWLLLSTEPVEASQVRNAYRHGCMDALNRSQWPRSAQEYCSKMADELQLPR